MAWEQLPVDYTDAVWSGLKRYIEINNEDGTVSFQDVTVYNDKEKSFFGAKDANRMNEALNVLMNKVENGIPLNTPVADDILLAGFTPLVDRGTPIAENDTVLVGVQKLDKRLRDIEGSGTGGDGGGGNIEYRLPIATLTTLGGVLSGTNIDVNSATGAVVVTGKRDSTVAFADIPTENVTYNELLARIAGYYAEISGKLKAPDKSAAGQLIASDGAGGTTPMEIATEVIEGDTRPVSGGAVYTQIGNINALLRTI